MSDIDFSSPFERQSVLLNITEISKHQSDFSDLLTEAPDDVPQVDTSGGNQGGGDDTDTPDEGFEQAPVDNNEGGGDDTANEDNDDFNIDAEDDISDGGGDTAGTTNTGGGDGGSPETQNVEVDNPAKQKDREIFDSLSPQEQKIKTVKLKELYMDLYNRCDQIIDKFNNLGVDYEDLGEPVHKCINTLFALKQDISTYLLYLFDTKTYTENDITFNRFLVALNMIKLITKDMRTSHKEDIEKSEKSENN